MEIFIRELGQRQTRFGRLIFDLQYYGKTQRDICGKIPVQFNEDEGKQKLIIMNIEHDITVNSS